jgi:uncharacterized RDD family membrane protein YckC
MGYFYAEGDRRMGPVNKAQLMELVKIGKVTARTKIMAADSPGWVELGEMLARLRGGNGGGRPAAPPAPAHGAAPAHEEAPIRKTPCAQCGVDFVHSELVRIQNRWLCPVCKAEFVQMMKEGVQARGDFRYAGFWIRFLALSIDGLALWLLNLIAVLPFILAPMLQGGSFLFALADLPGFVNLIGTVLAVGYSAFFVGRFAATPGKLALGLRIVTEEGGRVSYLRAFCRYLASIVSGAILGIGYLMAAFDSEKRALHDRICSTRVIRK